MKRLIIFSQNFYRRYFNPTSNKSIDTVIIVTACHTRSGRVVKKRERLVTMINPTLPE